MGEEDDSRGRTPQDNSGARPAGVKGQGSAEPEGPMTPAGTMVSLASFKNIYLGISTGQAYKFPAIQGSDADGHPWSGSYSIIADGPRSFEGMTVTRSREVVALKMTNGVPVVSISTKYFDLSDSGIYKIVFNSGVSYTPITQAALPSVVQVGESGEIGTFAGSDTTTVTVTWTVKPALNGSSVLQVSSVITGGADSASEIDSYLLDPAGTPKTVTLSATAMGTTVTLIGDKSNNDHKGE